MDKYLDPVEDTTYEGAEVPKCEMMIVCKFCHSVL